MGPKIYEAEEVERAKGYEQKEKSIWERLHKIHNFHHFCVYELADDPISDLEESEFDSNDSDMILNSDAEDVSSESEEESSEIEEES